ncbi:MAG: tetratricopeptide repeat protein [Halochromatium sp.]|uniref:tetratricopeptide repeat protein n=1 Tax=Halochromatium sp. TaxID=2049430 RepID=UPI0039799EC7
MPTRPPRHSSLAPGSNRPRVGRVLTTLAGGPEVVLRLIQVCEQQRDYGSAAGYLRAALRRLPEHAALAEKRARYQALGAW